MPTYLTRPVFDFRVNRADLPRKTFAYDLRERRLAFAAPVFEPLESFTVQGFEFGISLRDETELAAFDAFLDATRGRMNGFWIASPFEAIQIEPDVTSNVTFLIKDQNLRDTLGDHPSTHLVFQKAGETDQYEQVESVTLTADSREQVTLANAMAEPVNHTWTVRKLLYVRFARDEQEEDWTADNRQRRTLRVIELPTEYAAIETGQEPVFLYRFALALPTPQYWNFTGLNETISSTLNGSISSTPFLTFPMVHRDHNRTMRSDEEGLTIESWYDAGNPLSRFIPFSLKRDLQVAVFETTYASPNAVDVVFTGSVASVEPRGKQLVAKCQSLPDALGQAFPSFLIQATCNYAVFNASCGRNKTDFAAVVTITATDGRKITCTAANPPVGGEAQSTDFNYFALGWLEGGTGANYLESTIGQSQQVGTTLTLRLKDPLPNVPGDPTYWIGKSVTIYPGCDGSFEHCVNKFYNRRRRGAHDYVPTTNPGVKAVPLDTAHGNKK